MTLTIYFDLELSKTFVTIIQMGFKKTVFSKKYQGAAKIKKLSFQNQH